MCIRYDKEIRGYMRGATESMDSLNILYLPCHATLEFDEIKLFTEMGHKVFSLQGSYTNPANPADPKRPAIPTNIDPATYQQLMYVTAQCSKDNIHEELIRWADVIFVSHRDDWILNNWKNMKHKQVVWRTIGQSVPQTENRLALCRTEGLKIVRYSPMEKEISGYIGEDAMIRFYKDENEFCGWTGEEPSVITVCQSMKQRDDACGYSIFQKGTKGLNAKLYGTQSLNADMTPMDDPLWNGQLSYEDLKKAYRENAVYFCTGTYPSSYTLNFLEAFMTGIPVVAIGEALSDRPHYNIHAYEVSKIIVNGVNGYCSDDVKELHEWTEMLLKDKVKAKEIGDAGRKTAIELFGKQTISNQWKVFFEQL